MSPPHVPVSKNVHRLDSWKEIAGYFRRGVRTVQRWEQEEGLPVHRLQHEKLGSAYAFAHELDAWLAARGRNAGAATVTPSVAVLPFADRSEAGDQAYFCDGVAEEILHALSRIRGLRTASRTAAFQHRTAGPDLRRVGRQLEVASVLVGNVRKSGARLRVAVELVACDSGFQIWSDRYDRAVGDIFAIQGEIAARVAAALEVTLSVREQKSLRARATEDFGAYDCYLRGRRLYCEYSPSAVAEAIRMFERAARLDPGYASAFAGLADCWSYLCLYSDGNEEAWRRVDEASRRALETDPLSAHAQASRGLSLSISGRIEEADRAFEESARLDPDLFEGHYFRARHCFALGRLEEAADAYARAMEARPEDYQSPLLAAQIECDLGRAERGAALRKRGLGIAERHLHLNPDDTRALYMTANGLAAMRDTERSRQFAVRALESAPCDPMNLYNVGCVYALIGMREPALDCLERAAGAGLTQKGWYEHDSNLNALRSEPRFLALLERLSRAD